MFFFLSALRGSGSQFSFTSSKQAHSIQLTKEPLHKSTLTMTCTTLTTSKLNNLHRIPNSQVDLSHFFNSQCKNNTHFPLTYCIGCLNFYKETINSSCYHKGYLGFITKLREHFRLCSLRFRDQKTFTWGRKFRLELLLLSPLTTNKTFFFLGKLSLLYFGDQIHILSILALWAFPSCNSPKSKFPFLFEGNR